MPQITFPEGFLWGTATAAHQVEGGNCNNDWWDWEHTPGSGCREASGDACDHFNRYPDDIKMLADLGFGSYRFSVEWSRIEPAEGEFSTAALDHYRRMCATCHENGITPIVTYHHFTTPRWAMAGSGWDDSAMVDRFTRYVEGTTAALGDVTGWACTFNEPNGVATWGYLAGAFPPGRRDRDARNGATENFIASHAKASGVLHAGPGDFPVGITLAMSDFQAVDGGEVYRDRIRRNMEDLYLEAVRGDDFVGVQTYSRTRVGPEGALGPADGLETTQMGYEFWPEALEATIRRAWEVTDGTPILVTENGIGTEDDTRRIEYVTRALQGVRNALDDGIDVRGYTCWTLLDNFEWALGYMPKFGLVAVDRETQKRTPKQSAKWLGKIAKANAL
jgi:beta-glucosidase